MPKLDLNTVNCAAVDTVEGVDLLILGMDQSRLPLSNVELAVRAGSTISFCREPFLFSGTTRAHIQWTAFEGWQRRRKVTMLLELHASDARGMAVRSACLVENQLLLSADPVHRSAWRGALSLLNSEGSPELGDIAAIFSLAVDMFDGSWVQAQHANVQKGSTQLTPSTGEVPRSVAIWPPQPDPHEVRRRIGSRAHSQLQWFQNILKSFLQSDWSHENQNQGKQQSIQYSDDQRDNQDDGEVQVARSTPKTKSIDRASMAAKRMWDYAFKNFSQLCNKIWELCPVAETALDIWPASIFSFLAIMAVFKAARRMAPDLSLGVSAEVLCDDFLRLMFKERLQHEDFCCPKDFRYRSERFPALSYDLHTTFNIQPHPDLAIVLVALLVDRHLRNPWFYGDQELEWISSPSFISNADTREACLRIWARISAILHAKI
jgi:hypothetical protein